MLKPSRKIFPFLFLIAFGIKSQSIITTVAGNGAVGYSGDGSLATSAKLNSPNGIIVDISGNLYISDYSNNVIRKVSASGIITTFAGTGIAGFSGDGGQASLAQLNSPANLAIDTGGNIYVADEVNNVVRKINPIGIISTVAGNHTLGYSGDGGPALMAKLYNPTSLVVDKIGNLFISDVGNSVVRKVNTSGIITTIAGNHTSGYSGDGGTATSAQLCSPIGIGGDAAGNIYIADACNNVIRKVDQSGIITTIAGNHTSGYSGDGGPATAAALKKPEGTIATDAAGSVYFGDWNNQVIRKINSFGIISTIAGSGIAGYSGDGGPPLTAELNQPLGIAFDAIGNMYFADEFNNVIRKVSGIADISEITVKNEVRVYPNPANNYIVVDFVEETETINIYNSLGETVLQKKDKTLHKQIDISNLASGIYIVRGQYSYTKFIKE